MTLRPAVNAVAILACFVSVTHAADYAPVVVAAGQAPLIYPESPTELLATSAQTNNSLSMLVIYDLPGGGLVAPIDQSMGTAYYVLEGTYRFTLDDKDYDLTAGAAIVLPPSQVVQYKNTGSTVGRLLFVSAPGGGDTHALEAAEQHHMSPETTAALNAQYGLKR